MALINTLKFSNGAVSAAKSTFSSPAIQIQPVSTPLLSSKIVSTRLNTTLPVHEITTPITAYVPTAGILAKEVVSVTGVGHYILRPPSHFVTPAPPIIEPPPNKQHPIPSAPPPVEVAIIPPFKTEKNVIVPEYSPPGPPAPPPPINLKSGLLGSSYDNSHALKSSKKFETYEQLTGILNDRPEIVMMTNFLPMFNGTATSDPSFIQRVENSGMNPYLTDAGKYVDTYLQSRNLRHVDVVNLIRNLRSSYPYTKALFKEQKRLVEVGLSDLRSDVDYLFELISRLEKMKSQLDMRDPIHVVDPINVLRTYLVGFDAASQKILESTANRHMSAKYDFHDVLVRLGYKAENVKIFASSKLWIQTLLELRNILQHHSRELAGAWHNSTAQHSDATSIHNPVNSYYASNWGSVGVVSNGVATSLSVPSLSEIRGLIGTQVEQAVSSLNNAWQLLNQSTFFGSEEVRIATLVNLISKEFRYSYGLSNREVARVLEEQYNYRVAQVGNADVFSSIIGRIGDNITQFPAVQTDALTNISQRQIDDVGVLTFEPKYIDAPGNVGSTTLPGGVHYIDSVLKTDGQKFNTSRIEELTKTFDKSYKSFATIVNGMNLMALPSVGVQGASSLSNPTKFIQDFAKRIINTDSGQTLPEVAADRLGSIYSMALSYPRIKSALFLYALANIEGSTFRTVGSVTVNTVSGSVTTGGVTFDKNGNVVGDSSSSGRTNGISRDLIKFIVTEVEKIVVQTAGTAGNKAVKGTVPSLTNDMIASALATGTVITRAIESTMKHVLTDMRYQDRILIDGEHTRINGYLDTTFLMLVFDAIISMAGRWTGQVINSVTAGTTAETKGTYTYNVGFTSNNWMNFYTAIYLRLENEIALTQQILYAVLNTLQKLSDSFKNGVNFLNNQSTIDKLQKISGVLNRNDMINMLFSEQQIMIAAAEAQEMSERLENNASLPTNVDTDADGDIDAEDELKMLDDALVTPKVRDAVFGLFGDPEFVSKKGDNKKLLTIGIPQGFVQRLKQRTDTKALNLFKDPGNKQGDIISIVVYKIDLLNPDVVFKSKKMLFEMSRFPVRNEAKFLNIPEKPTPEDVFSAIPTRDFGNGKLNDMSYWSDGDVPPNPNVKTTFADESYSFLTTEERYDIIKNHITSYLADVYIRLMTGVDLADDRFNMFNLPRSMHHEMVGIIVEHFVDYVVNSTKQQQTDSTAAPPTGGVLFSTTANRRAGYSPGSDQVADNFTLDPSGIAGFVSRVSQFNAIKGLPAVVTLEEQNKLGSLQDNLKLLTPRNVPVTMHGFRIISNMAHMLTTLSDPTTLQQYALMPRQFDRVFNIVIDTNDFEIDEKVMNETPQGAETFTQLIQAGEIIPEDEEESSIKSLFGVDGDSRGALPRALRQVLSKPSGRPFVQNKIVQPIPTFKAPRKLKSQGDLIMEKYFITIETYGEDD